MDASHFLIADATPQSRNSRKGEKKPNTYAQFTKNSRYPPSSESAYATQGFDSHHITTCTALHCLCCLQDHLCHSRRTVQSTSVHARSSHTQPLSHTHTHTHTRTHTHTHHIIATQSSRLNHNKLVTSVSARRTATALSLGEGEQPDTKKWVWSTHGWHAPFHRLAASLCHSTQRSNRACRRLLHSCDGTVCACTAWGQRAKA